MSDFTEACQPDPTACTCSGHRYPGVRHISPCCDEPHIDQQVRTPEEQLLWDIFGEQGGSDG